MFIANTRNVITVYIGMAYMIYKAYNLLNLDKTVQKWEGVWVRFLLGSDCFKRHPRVVGKERKLS